MFMVGLVLAAAVGSFLQTVTGFGAALAVLLYLTPFLSITEAPSVAAAVCIILNFTLVIRYRKAIRIKPIFWPVLIYSVVSLVMVFQIHSFNAVFLTVLFGVFLIALAVFNFAFAEKAKVNSESTRTMILFNGLSGAIAALFTVSGPTLALYYLSLCGTGDFYVASIQLAFLITNIVLVAGRFANGLMTVSMIPMVAVGVAGALVGQFVGVAVRSRLDAKRIKQMVYAVTGICGIVVILQQFM